MPKSQGVITGRFPIDDRYVEIFDRKYKYMYGEFDDAFVSYGTWVEYNVEKAPSDHPKNCNFYAEKVHSVEQYKSEAPINDEFGDKAMNVHEFNKVDFFEYDSTDERLFHKSSIYFTGQTYASRYYGDVQMNTDSKNKLMKYQIENLDVVLKLIPSANYVRGPNWEVIHYVNKGKNYSISGFLSIRGLVRRGPGGTVRDRSEVTVVQDGLRPKFQVSAPVPARSSGFGTPSRGSGLKLIETPPSTAAIKPEASKLKSTGFGAPSTEEDSWEVASKPTIQNSNSAPQRKGFKPAGNGGGLSKFGNAKF